MVDMGFGGGRWGNHGTSRYHSIVSESQCCSGRCCIDRSVFIVADRCFVSLSLCLVVVLGLVVVGHFGVLSLGCLVVLLVSCRCRVGRWVFMGVMVVLVVVVVIILVVVMVLFGVFVIVVVELRENMKFQQKKLSSHTTTRHF